MKILEQHDKSTTKIIAIVIIILLLIGGALTMFYDFADKTVSFSEEEIAAATKTAQTELNQAFAAAENYTFNERTEAIQSIGYREPKIEKSTMTFEKHNESDSYILLKLQPHESYENMSRVLIQIFDKENGALITELENVLTWKETQ
ncbi:hypothetical protein D1B33_01220 [Lysinibacillus yapensis]|uniref:Uncharacterized protein n=1 Tax=Ureibacillus yapensis TaxID=2304605 RepID=A0A396SDV1_9BACL|nr:hypothetical protein [Lysinibacillus yapensis]RHW39494.1 hypothetical protein D1B33_01220 [Lysinibacillus yapensis]